MSTSKVSSLITVLVDARIVKIRGSFYGPILCKVNKTHNRPICTYQNQSFDPLGMFFSFHEREKAYTQKKKALFYNLLYSSLLQIVFSVQYVNLHHQIRFHTSLPLITHHQPTSSHILGQKCSSQHSLRSSTSTPRGAASQHGTTGTHRNKLLLVGGLKATPFIE